MDLELRGKVALVTGASRGIGLAIAERLSLEGCTVALLARNRAGLDELATRLSGPTSVHLADMTDPLAAIAAIDEIARQWGRLDVLVTNIGSGASVPPGAEKAVEWRRVLDLNLFTATNALESATPLMRAGTGDRSVVCISSICGLEALGAPVTYSAAKAALNATVRGLARPLARDGIRINALAPGNILTTDGTWARKRREDAGAVDAMLEREVALRRLGVPEEIADICAFLASPRAAFITGTTIVADGGQVRS